MKKIFLLAFGALCLTATTAFGQPGTWQPRNPPPFTSRLAPYTFVLNGVAYAGGGADSTGTRNDLWAYNPTTDAWTPRASLPGPSRAAASTFVVGSMAYVVAGEEDTPSGTVTDLNDAWAYNPLTNTWTALAPLPASGRVGAYGFAVGGKGYVGGGGDFASPNTVQFTDCWSFDPATGQWAASSAPPTPAVTLSAGFALGSYGYVAGGLDAASFGSTYSQQVWRFDAATNQWTPRADLPGPRAYAGSFSAAGYGYAVEGVSGFDPLNGDFLPAHDVLRYVPATDNWITLPPVPGAIGRIFPLCFALGTTAYVGQGEEATQQQPFLNDFWQLTGLPTGVAPPTAESLFTLAPNPARHAVRLTGAPTGPVALTDALGRLVRTATSAPGQAETVLDLAGLPAGLYSVQCGAQTRRLVVE